MRDELIYYVKFEITARLIMNNSFTSPCCKFKLLYIRPLLKLIKKFGNNNDLVFF